MPGGIVLRRDGARPLRIAPRAALRRQFDVGGGAAIRLGLHVLGDGRAAHEVAVLPPARWRVWPVHAAALHDAVAAAVAALAAAPCPVWSQPAVSIAFGDAVAQWEAQRLALREALRFAIGGFMLALAEAGWDPPAEAIDPQAASRYLAETFAGGAVSSAFKP